MMNWFLQQVFDDFYGVFTDNVEDPQYKKLNWFLKGQKIFIFWGTITKLFD